MKWMPSDRLSLAILYICPSNLNDLKSKISLLLILILISFHILTDFNNPIENRP